MLCFTTHCSDLCLLVFLIIILGGIALFLLSWIIPILIWIVVFTYYLITGRCKDFIAKCKNDPLFMTMDKETGKIYWKL